MVKDVSIRFFLSVFLYYNQVPIVMPSPVDYCGNRENKKRALDCHQRSSEYINSWQPGKDQGFDPPLLLIIFLAIFAFGGLVWFGTRVDSQVAFLSSWSIISELQNGLGGHDDSSEVGSSVAITTTGHWTIHGCACDGVAAAALVVVSSPAVGLSPQFSSSFPRLTDY